MSETPPTTAEQADAQAKVERALKRLLAFARSPGEGGTVWHGSAMGRWGLHFQSSGMCPNSLAPHFLPKNRMKVGSRISIVFRQYASETQRRIQKLLVECRTQKLLCCIHQLQCRIQELIQPVPQFSKFGSTTVQGWFKVDMGWFRVYRRFV